jgi:hypothetical protein
MTFDDTRYTKPTWMKAGPFRSLTERELTDDDGVAFFEYFNVRNASVGHMAMYCTGTIPCWSGSSPSADRLSIRKAVTLYEYIQSLLNLFCLVIGTVSICYCIWITVRSIWQSAKDRVRNLVDRKLNHNFELSSGDTSRDSQGRSCIRTKTRLMSPDILLSLFLLQRSRPQQCLQCIRLRNEGGPWPQLQ